MVDQSALHGQQFMSCGKQRVHAHQPDAIMLLGWQCFQDAHQGHSAHEKNSHHHCCNLNGETSHSRSVHDGGPRLNRCVTHASGLCNVTGLSCHAYLDHDSCLLLCCLDLASLDLWDFTCKQTVHNGRPSRSLVHTPRPEQHRATLSV